ncbi:fatty acid-binding protein, adipocyte-like [Mixophyes fleayi]|uniref:fatty acid-binding protein, adipocyte-like n=1 Tax=Mixophyes fleayi TaxID=3061075 RepID=UPI003F4E36FD
MGDIFVGTWKLVEPDKDAFDKYLEICGVNNASRKMANAWSPDMIISINVEEWCIKQENTLKSTSMIFKLNEAFDETTADGRVVKTIITLVNAVLKQVQKWDDKESTITRQVKDGRLVTICVIGDVKCTRVYDRK